MSTNIPRLVLWLLPGILFLAFDDAIGVMADGQENKEQKEPTPSQVVKQWTDAVAKRDMKTAVKLASRTMNKVYLDLLEQQWFLRYQGETKIIHEEVSGDRAVVVYRIENKRAIIAEIRYRMNALAKEGGAWKVTQEEGSVRLKLAK